MRGTCNTTLQSFENASISSDKYRRSFSHVPFYGTTPFMSWVYKEVKLCSKSTSSRFVLALLSC